MQMGRVPELPLADLLDVEASECDDGSDSTLSRFGGLDDMETDKILVLEGRMGGWGVQQWLTKHFKTCRATPASPLTECAKAHSPVCASIVVQVRN